MSSNSNVHDLVQRLQRKAPEILDLMSAESDEEFEAVFDGILGKSIHDMEKNKKNFQALDEEGLSGVLALALSMPGLTVTQEANSNGHVDLTIEADHCSPVRIKLGEAKIYHGPKYHISGLEQLIGRYTTGRDGRGLLIEYVKKPGIKAKIAAIRKKMDTELPLNQAGQSKDHMLKWSFLTEHKHSSGECLQVGHIGCNLYYEGQ